MSTALAERQAIDPSLVEQVLIKGDLRQLSPAQKVSYYNAVCSSLGLNPLTQPFAYITLNGKEVLYAKRDAAEQLRKVHNISVTIKAREVIEGIYIVTAQASMPNGRVDESTGAVPIETLKGEARANAVMKAETKAKRRVTLSICGLGMLDETEVESIQQPLVVEAPKAVQRAPLPEGCFYIVAAAVKQWGGDITIVDANGVEATYPTPQRQCAELAEQIAQANPAVPVRVVRVVGSRDKVEKIKEVHRYEPPPAELSPEESAALDAEIAAKDQAF